MKYATTPGAAWAQVAGAALLIGVGVAWWQGAFDQALWQVSLNHRPCLVMVSGGALCGDAAVNYCRSLVLSDLSTVGRRACNEVLSQ